MRLEAEPEVSVAGVTASAAETEAWLRTGEADVMVVDVELGDGDGIELARRARDLNPSLQVVVLTGHEETELAIRALRIDAGGFVTKDATTEELGKAIRCAVRDETWISPRLLRPLVRRLMSAGDDRSDAAKRLDDLTAREREILECMVGGMDRAAIARELFLSTNTVRTHTRNLLAKLAVHSSLEAVALARRAGVWPRPRTAS